MTGVRSNPTFSLRRVGALVRRHWYVLRSSWPRVGELAYWPTIQMLVWGFITLFFSTKTTYVAEAFGVLLSAALLWDVLFRGQLGVSLSFFEEMYARNLGNLFVTPLRPIEMIAALLTMSFIRTLAGIVPASILANVFFDFSIYSMGPVLGLFFLNLLIFAWSIGLIVSGMVLRYGLGAENLAWGAIFALLPLSAVYYPVAILPDWLQPIAWSLPTVHVFEGMRAVLLDHNFRPDLLGSAFMLNLVYLGVGIGVFLLAFRAARQRGLLIQQGE
jgi:ABC-2 type transport system permease protein